MLSSFAIPPVHGLREPWLCRSGRAILHLHERLESLAIQITNSSNGGLVGVHWPVARMGMPRLTERRVWVRLLRRKARLV
jgi:hypothetical protein